VRSTDRAAVRILNGGQLTERRSTDRTAVD
jgi:hypothetical protein